MVQKKKKKKKKKGIKSNFIIKESIILYCMKYFNKFPISPLFNLFSYCIYLQKKIFLKQK